MKSTDIFCLSQASTAICLSMDHGSSSSSSSTMQLGGRTIDRHNPIISDSRRSNKTSSNIPSSSSSSSSVSLVNPQPSKIKTKTKSFDKIIKSSIKQKDTKKSTSDSVKKTSFASNPIERLVSPPCSSRYLLADRDRQFFDGLPEFDPVFGLPPAEDQKKTELAVNEVESTTSSMELPSSQPKTSSSNQVVVLRVSLHCKGCEGKLRKHLSRMKGVTSYNIDFAAKKVTIVGDVTPSSILASVSKVKNARLWAPTATATATPVSATSPAQTN